MIEAVYPNSHAAIGSHFLFYLFLTAHICLFVDLSPLQKRATCKLNFLIASLLAAAIPLAITTLVTFPSLAVELFWGVTSALALGVFITLNVQRLLNIDVDF